MGFRWYDKKNLFMITVNNNLGKTFTDVPLTLDAITGEMIDIHIQIPTVPPGQTTYYLYKEFQNSIFTVVIGRGM